MNMYYCRTASIFDLDKSFVKSRDIIAAGNKEIFKPHRAEEITFGAAVCLAQQLQILIKSAVIFCNRHLIIIHYDDQIAFELSGHI